LTVTEVIVTLQNEAIYKVFDMKIVTAEQMMRIDRKCAENGLPTSLLMENAGRAVAEEVTHILGDVAWKSIVILAGPGNNGGDGLVAGRYLHDRGARVTLCLFGNKRENDKNLELVRERNIHCIAVSDEKDIKEIGKILKAADAAIDALFGTGNNRPLTGIYKQALAEVSRAVQVKPDIHVFALDIPSGMNADTGAVDEACLYADDTITLGYPKIGLYQHPGSVRAGRITIVDIGIPAGMADDIDLELNTAFRVKKVLPKRPFDANKGTFGKVLVVAGSINYIGAAYLACSGAMRVGAGLVTLATASSLQPILAAKLTEATYLPLPEKEKGIISPEAAGVILGEIGKYNVLLIGCGLGQSLSIKAFLKALLLRSDTGLPVTVLDADVLNMLANEPEWWRQITGNAILTPHPGEIARLAGTTVEEVQRSRLKVAEEAAAKWNQTVVLKGAYTVIASPGCSAIISPAANPGLASAGTGDVLAGVIAGLAAQGCKPADAATCGVYIHAEAGEMVKNQMGDTGMLASDLLPVLPVVIKQLKNKKSEEL
jgi:ADP-dependent NAD(P)H-hydrate dehydratase / NAD(P)H-hydrate epimerase